MRRVITFLVISGFSLLDLRHLYIDELYYFYEQTIYTLEKMGRLKEGAYAKIKARSNSGGVDNTVRQLKRQILSGITSRNKKQ